MGALNRNEKPKLSASAKLLSFAYFLIVVAAAYYLSGLAVHELDKDDVLNVNIPKTDKPVPLWIFQLAIGLIIFFFLQFFLVFLFGLIRGREKNVYKQ